jgi:hypothetical protein
MDDAAPAVERAAPPGAIDPGNGSTWRADQGISLVLDGIEKRLGGHRAG